MTAATTMVILFTIATAVAIAVRRVQIPYTVALLVVGLALGSIHVLEVPELTQDVLFAVFLPGLLFEAGFHVDYVEFRRNSFAIVALALPGVVAAIGLTAAIVTATFGLFGLQFTFRDGLVLGALLAATDPIAVIGLFRAFKVPKRLLLLVESESLFNDGTAIVLLALILRYVSGGAVTGSSLLIDFLTITGGGVAVGIALGLAASLLTKGVDDAMIEITITVIAAYGSFAFAESVHVSGVIATVTAAMMCGNYGQRVGMSRATRIAVVSFWEYIAFALNSLVFLLIGFEVSAIRLLESSGEIGIAYLAVLGARVGIIVVVIWALRRTSERMPLKWAAPLSWGGLRGALSMVLALSLPRDLPHRGLLVTMTFGVVLASILIQGLTLAPLLRRLHIGSDPPKAIEPEA